MPSKSRLSPRKRRASQTARWVRQKLRRQHALFPEPPFPLEDVGDHKAFRVVPDAKDGGIFGKWIVDEAGLPAYEYTLNQYEDPRAAYPNTENMDRRDHWHQIGNNRITGLASNDGLVQVYLCDRGGVFLNRFDEEEEPGVLGIILMVVKILFAVPWHWIANRYQQESTVGYDAPRRLARSVLDSRKAREQDSSLHAYAGGFGYIHDGEEAWATAYRYRPENTDDTRRVFGMGYYETGIDYRNIRSTRNVYAPAGDAPVMMVEVSLENTGDSAANISYYEYWDVNVHQLKLEWARTGIFALLGDAERRKINHQFEPSIDWDKDMNAMRFHQQPPDNAPAPDSVNQIDFYPADIFLADLSGTPDARYCNKEAFFGHGGADQPDLVHSRQADDPPVDTNDPMPYCMVLRRDVQIEAGQSVHLRFAYGTIRPEESLDFLKPDTDPKSLVGWQQQFHNTINSDDPLADTLVDWKKRLAYFSIGDAPELQREMAWHAYSLLSSTLYHDYYQTHIVPQGSAYLYLHGADGAPRDQALFAVPLSYLDPALAKETLRLIMRLTYVDQNKISYAFAGYGILSGAAIHDNPSDLSLFFMLGMVEYIAATGDTEFLNEEVPFYPCDAQSPSGMTVMDHVRVAAKHLLDDIGLGSENLIRITDGDWSDGVVLSTVLADMLRLSYGNSVKSGESIPNSQMACYVLPRIANLIEEHDAELTNRLREWVPILEKALKKQWTGKWYTRAILRTHRDKPHVLHDKKIDLEAQPWALISDVAKKAGHEDTLVKSVVSNLDRPSPVGAEMMADGMVWPAISQLLTWGYTRSYPKHAWRSFVYNTFARHAEVFPEVWFKIWSAPDGTNGINGKDPGYSWASPVTPVSDFPVMNNNPHAMALLALLRVCGVEPTEAGDGLHIRPQVPDRYVLDLPLLKLDVTLARIQGEYRACVWGERALYVHVPDGAKDVKVRLRGQPRDAMIDDGMVVLKLTFEEGESVSFDVSWSM